MSSVLRLGVYRERIERYIQPASSGKPPAPPPVIPKTVSRNQKAEPQSTAAEEIMTVTLERDSASRSLGLRLSGNCSEAGIYIVDIQDGGVTHSDGRLQKFDRLLFINGQDVRHSRLEQASALIQNNDKVSLVVARRNNAAAFITNLDEKGDADDAGDIEDAGNGIPPSPAISSHARSKSAPAINHEKNGNGNSNGGEAENSSGGEDNSPDSSSNELSDEDEVDEVDGGFGRKDGGDNQRAKKDRIRNGSFVKRAVRKITASSSASAGESSRKIRAKHYSSSPTLQNPPRSNSHSVEDLDEENSPSSHVYDLPEGEDYMAIYETLDRVRSRAKNGNGACASGDAAAATADKMSKAKSHSMEALETPTPSLKSFEFPDVNQESCNDEDRRRHRSKLQQQQQQQQQQQPQPKEIKQQQVRQNQHHIYQQLEAENGGASSMAAFLKRALRIEGPQLQQRLVTVKKNVKESLGMRIGGGIGSNEGDTPIYIANIHPHGCIGKSKQMKKGDLLLAVDDVSLCGLTHSQAVATLKATINRGQVVLGVMDGPETSFGASNFIPSWMYWQRLPRSLQYPKTVILHRRESASWGFSIVGGGADPNNYTADNAGAEPIHVLFVVPDSPASKDAKIKCGDRLLAVDGHSLENIPHSVAVTMLKQTSTRVVLEVVSWMGTEL